MELAGLSEQITGLVTAAAAYVVAVDGGARSAASGMVWEPGVVVTVDHALRHEESAEVTLPDGQKVTGKIAGRDASSDVAVLRVEGAPSGLRRAEREAAVGQMVVLVGRSAEFGPAASLGMVSLVGGPWRSWRGNSLERMIRLDAGFYGGTSGSAVVDAEGRVIGMATAGMTRGAGMAIPVATLDRMVTALLAKGHVARPYVGVTLQQIAQGLIVLSVESNGPAQQAGVLVGDILIEADGKPVKDTDDLQAALADAGVGGTVQLALVRGGQAATVAVVAAARPRRTA